MSEGPTIRARLAAAVARRQPPRAPHIRLTAPGGEPRVLEPDDPVAPALAAAAEALLSAAQRASRG